MLGRLGQGSCVVRRFCALLCCGVLLQLAAAGSTSAALADADLSITVGFGNLGEIESARTTTTSRTFAISVIVEASSFTPEPVRLQIQLPEGLHWGSNAPDASEGCTGTAQVVCIGTTTTGSGNGGNFAFWSWQVVADRTGHFEIDASIAGMGPDPDNSNNSRTFSFDVLTPGGGGGGGGGGSGSVVKASGVKFSPARPKAGSTVVASVRVTKGASPARPTGTRCAASIGNVKLKGVARSRSGLAACSFKTPRSAKGKLLRGSVAFHVGDSSFSKRYTTRLT